jgi:hypothetical protein
MFDSALFENAFVMAFIKFAVLGSAGEIVAKLLTKKKIKFGIILWSMLVWGVLGLIIKFCFTGFNGFADKIASEGLIPESELSIAFFTSFFTNAFFGPWVIILHRLFDNIIYGKFTVPTDGIKGAMLTLAWFWIPAHTITFMMQGEWQVTLAAIWSFVLGLILGIFKNMQSKKKK